MTGLVTQETFDQLRREDDCGEYWSARDLCSVLGYDRWESFADAVTRARHSINAGGQQAPDHIRGATKMVSIGSGAERPLIDHRLTRFGAYMVAMNGDPRKPEIAAAQTYFAVRTRQAEMAPASTQVAMPTHSEALRGWAAEVEAREMAEARVAELEPAAGAWTALASAEGDYSLREAAEVLSRDPMIVTGQNRLMNFLREVGWLDRRGIPYQAQINLGRLAVRTTTYDNPHTGEPQLSTQTRVTGKGLDAIRKLMYRPPSAGLRAVPGGS